MIRVAFVVAFGLAGCAGNPGASPAPAPAMEPFAQLSPVGPLPGLATDQPEAANPFTGNAEGLARGRRHFTAYNCAGCHGDHGGGGMGPSLRDAAWLYGGSDVSIADSIRAGRAYGMPAWGRMLTDDQIWELAAYIKSLRTPDEPSPPRVD
jgi:cytochrome c oxidase cbb3-type subunit 3